MPLNLRIGLRLLPRRLLARRLERALDALDVVAENGKIVSKWDLLHPARMRRAFIRHRLAYRTKAFLAAVANLAAPTEGAIVLFPIFIAMWFLAPKQQRAQALAPYRLYLVRCEIEDLQDEIERRLARRKPSQ